MDLSCLAIKARHLLFFTSFIALQLFICPRETQMVLELRSEGNFPIKRHCKGRWGASPITFLPSMFQWLFMRCLSLLADCKTGLKMSREKCQNGLTWPKDVPLQVKRGDSYPFKLGITWGGVTTKQ